MRIIYAYEADAADINTQSGHPFSILEQLERRSDVVRVFPLRQQLRYLFAGKYLYYRKRGLTYRPDREPLLLKSLARQIERRVRGIEADCLFAPGSHVLAELNLTLPMIFCADATFANMLEFYDSFTGCAPRFIEQGHAMDRKALANCAAAIYPSQWAARSAIEDYGADPAKVHVVPFGANIEAPDDDTVRAQIGARTFEELRLLFVGRDWYRKGGDIVLATCDVLSKRGVPLRLDLVGLPRVPVALPSYARSHGLLDKNIPDQRQHIDTLYAQAHFLFVPSRADAFPQVFAEAASFGVPGLAMALGGIPEIVESDITGVLAVPTTSPRQFAEAPADLFAAPARYFRMAEAFADAIEAAFAKPARYRNLAFASRARYCEQLNWDAFGARFMEVVKQIRLETSE